MSRKQIQLGNVENIENKSTKKRRAIQEKQTIEKLYAYKVFMRQNDNLLHSGSVPIESKLHRTYEEKKKTEASRDMFEAGFGICCFTELKDARNYNGTNYGKKEIWKVEIGDLREPAPKRPSIYNLDKIAEIRKDKKTSYRVILGRILKHLKRDEWPIGTKMADYVIPIEKVA
jgi:hypothetical protein